MKKLICESEARPSKIQHKKPCGDCPWSRKSLRGWLGGSSVSTWLQQVHGEGKIMCHTLKGPQCAGAAIYRANVFKSPRDKSVLQLPQDLKRVFGFDEFEQHHAKGPASIAARTSQPPTGKE